MIGSSSLMPPGLIRAQPGWPVAAPALMAPSANAANSPPDPAGAPVLPQAAMGSGWTPCWRTGSVLRQVRTSPAGYPLTLYTLPNGHRIIVEQRPVDIVGVRTLIDGGSILENPIFPSPLYRNTGLPSGLAHLDEHCRFLSTRNFPVKNTWLGMVDAMGARFNAGTGSEAIQHELFFNREDMPAMLRLHSESVLRPLYHAADMWQEKRNVLNEGAYRTRPPMARIFSKLSELLFDRPDIQTLGAASDVLSATPTQLAAFHNMAYAPTRMVTVISGNVNPDEALAILAPAFGDNPPRDRGASGNPAIRLALRPGETRSACIVDPQLGNSVVSIGFPAPPRENYMERMSMEFLQEMLSGDSASVLPQTLINGAHLASRMKSMYLPLRRTGSYRLDLHVAPGREQTALSGVMNTLGAFSGGLIPDSRLAAVRERLIRRHVESQANVESATMALGREAVGNTLPYTLNYAQLANLVRAEDLLRTAQKYLNPNTYAVVFGLPYTPGGAMPPQFRPAFQATLQPVAPNGGPVG